MVAQEIKINCGPCMKGNHENCNSDNCLCADVKYNHGVKRETIEDIFNNPNYLRPENEPREYERALTDALDLEDFEDNGMGNNSPTWVLVEMIKLLIVSRHMVSIIDITEHLKKWCRKYRVDENEIDIAIPTVFQDKDMFLQIKIICYKLGEIKKDILFEKSQLIEVAQWLKGRYFIKRIELTGDLLFFNDEYYKRDAEALIRRKGRECLLRSKNMDMTEIVHSIEDSCDVITWRDIESSIHMKCLLNGLYNIKTGIFTPKFSPDYIILSQIPHNYCEDSDFDRINEKVSSIIPEKSHRQSFYDWISSCLHPYTGIDFQFGNVGGSGTGKSQLGVLVEMGLGEDNCSSASIHLISKDLTTQKDCAFKMANIDYDLSNESVKQIDTLKKWITQDKFTARGIYERSSSFKPMSRLMFMANDLYEIANTDDAEAIYDRTYIIRVDKKFRHQTDEIKQVMKKTATVSQLEGFITYLLNNCTWMYENESYHHTMSVGVVEDVWNTFGNRIKMFVEKWIEKGEFRTETSEPFNKWMNYCISKNFKAKDKKQFSKIFDEIVGNTPTKTRIDQVECYAYTGFRIKRDDEVTKEETINLDGRTIEEKKEALKALLFYSVENISKIFSEIKKDQKSTELLELGES